LRLNDSVEALRDGDCSRAERRAEDAISALGLRPEPYELLAYCSSRRGDHALAVVRMRQALRRAPNDWRLHYGLAIVLAHAGRDPRPELQGARELNPREPLVVEAQASLSTDDPRVWRRRAARAQLPLRAPLPLPAPETVRGR
jgi:Flp pilus assembly protein TadD